MANPLDFINFPNKIYRYRFNELKATYFSGYIRIPEEQAHAKNFSDPDKMQESLCTFVVSDASFLKIYVNSPLENDDINVILSFHLDSYVQINHNKLAFVIRLEIYNNDPEKSIKKESRFIFQNRRITSITSFDIKWAELHTEKGFFNHPDDRNKKGYMQICFQIKISDTFHIPPLPLSQLIKPQKPKWEPFFRLVKFKEYNNPLSGYFVKEITSPFFITYRQLWDEERRNQALYNRLNELFKFKEDFQVSINSIKPLSEREYEIEFLILENKNQPQANQAQTNQPQANQSTKRVKINLVIIKEELLHIKN